MLLGKLRTRIKRAKSPKRWRKAAAVVKDVDDETLVRSAAMYLAQKAVMNKHHAIAITINCLGGFYGGHIHAYPCLGFHELLNEGLVGACECDTRSTFTMAMITALTNGRPGFISDPVIDTSTNQIIYAHCVAANKPFGPGDRPIPTRSSRTRKTAKAPRSARCCPSAT
jgi:L-fucose isomerase-like protein